MNIIEHICTQTLLKKIELEYAQILFDFSDALKPILPSYTHIIPAFNV